MGMKYILILLLFTSGFSFDIPEITVPGLMKKIWQAGKTVKREGSKPPKEVQQYVNKHWGEEIQESKQEWQRLSDTTVADTSGLKQDTVAKQNSFQNTDIIIQDEDMMFHLRNDSLQTLILFE